MYSVMSSPPISRDSPDSPLQLIFRDLFYRLAAFARSHDVFLKLEGFNITGSIKVKTAIGLVEDLEQRGIARPNETVLVESSSGNLGLALSLVCAIRGILHQVQADGLRGSLSRRLLLRGRKHARHPSR
ncbi:MAG: pyridoxal-phosphate dependent enzyme [Pseudolabrys sp.]|jgi:cysteine synthase A